MARICSRLLLTITLFFISSAQGHWCNRFGQVYFLYPPPPPPDHGRGLLVKCLAQSNATPDAINLIGSSEDVTDESQLCFLECYYKSLGIISEDKFNIERAFNIALHKYFLPQDLALARENLEQCKKSVFNDARFKCGLGYTVRKCFTEFAQKRDFLTLAK